MTGKLPLALVMLVLTLAPGCGAGRPCPVPAAPPYAWDPAARIVDAFPPKPPSSVRILIGGDSRERFPTEPPDGVPRDVSGCDTSFPLPRAFADARPSGASAFFFLGDMERSPPATAYFPALLAHCLDASVPFCPAFGNHEAMKHGGVALPHPEVVREDFFRSELGRCPTALPAAARDAGRVFYAVDLPGKVHLVALDNASGPGFGKEQLAWLDADLATARADGKVVIVGMHKALAENHVTQHSMDEDGATADSAVALARFEARGVALVVASHEHGYWELRHKLGEGGGLRGVITGGLGAPLRVCAGEDHAFFHYLVVDVTGQRVDVSVVRIGAPTIEKR